MVYGLTEFIPPLRCEAVLVPFLPFLLCRLGCHSSTKLRQISSHQQQCELCLPVIDL